MTDPMARGTTQTVPAQFERATPDSSETDVGFVLVHGAGLDAWVWDDLLSLVETPTLPVAFPTPDADQTVRHELRLQD